MALPPGTRLGPFEVVELLGAGGMGEVYRAKDPRLGREVAIKVLPSDVAAEPERLQRFEREARAVATLNHPHILTVYDVGTDDGRPYVVTELLEGETLREVLTRRTPTQRQVLGFAVQAAQGLAAAHQKGVIHRDLKPENLFLTTEGRLKILDFGLAKLAAPEKQLDTTGTTDTGPSRPGVLMGTVAYMSPEQVQALPLDARSDIFSFGVVLYELLSRRHPFRRETAPATLTAILHETPPDLQSQGKALVAAVSGIVGRCLEKQKEDRFQTSHDLALSLEAVLHAPAGSAALVDLEERSPYPGLRSFTEKDAGVFFGREEEVKTLWTRIRKRRLLAVIGPSGVGKTSFVRAGVVARRPTGWDALVATPGAQAYRGLGRALGPELASDTEALARLVDCADAQTAFDLLTRWRKSREEVLLVIDQFEELFTLNPPEVQEGFARLLGRLVAEANVHVLLSLRDDFLIRCQDRPELESVFERLTPLAALTGDRLRRALVEPARTLGYRLADESLIGEMVASVQGARASLPLLAFAMSRLWEQRDREKKLLRRESYEAIGGVGGALAQHAEETLERIGHERHALVREIFRNLVTSEGTRAVVDREELLSVFADQRDAAEKVLGTLIDNRLLTSYEVGEGEATEPASQAGGQSGTGSRAPLPGRRIEIVHESLLKAWPRLVRWQAQDEDGAVLRDQLKQAARLWEDKSRSPDLLWSGTAFQEFEMWRQRYPGRLTAVEEDFAQSMTERARRQRRLRQVVVASVVTASLAVASVTGVLWWRSEAARRLAAAEALRAEASKLLALAQARLEEDPTEALALTTASLELADSDEARVFAVRSLWAAPPALEVAGEWVKNPRFSPDGRHLAVSGHSPEVQIWSEDGSGPVVLPGHVTSPQGGVETRWPSRSLLVTGIGEAERVRVWSVPEGRLLRTIDFEAPTWWEVGPQRLLTQTFEDAGGSGGSPQVTLRSWQLPDGRAEHLGRVALSELEAATGDIEPQGRNWFFVRGRDVSLRPLPVGAGPDRLLCRLDAALARLRPMDRVDQWSIRDEEGSIQVWSFLPEGPKLERRIARPETAPRAIRPDVSGRWVLKLGHSEDRQLRLWDLEALPASRPLVLKRSGSWYISMAAFHPDGSWLVASTGNQTRLTFWPLVRRSPAVVDGYTPILRPVAFSPDGQWLATGWSEAGVRLWPMPGSGHHEVRTIALPGDWIVTGLQFDPRGRSLFAVGNMDQAWVVPLDGEPPQQLPVASTGTLLQAAAFSPSGRLVATAFTYGEGERTLRVWDTEARELRTHDLPVPSGAEGGAYAGGVVALQFEDESTLLSAGDGGIRRWDLNDGSHELVVPVEPGETHMGMSTSADGRWALTVGVSIADRKQGQPVLRDLATGTARPLPALRTESPHLDASGRVAIGADAEGTVRVMRAEGSEPHLLFGHEGAVSFLAVSPDLRWIATTGEDNTLRLWPMPDLDRPPFHTLPHDELVAKLRSLTNIRAVRDAEAPEGWSIQLDPFPGWKDVPTW